MTVSVSGVAVRLFRLFRLLDELRLRSTPITANALAASLGVSVRSIYRDIADLQALGAPIRGEGGVGYVMEKGYFLPSLRFEPDELDAIVFGLRLARERASPVLARAAERAAAKLSSAIADRDRDQLANSPLEAGPSHVGRMVSEPALFDRLRTAISKKEILRIRYSNLSGRDTTRIAWPLGLTAFDTAWLLTIWCDTSSGFRHLRLDRIGSIQATGTRYRPERGKRFADMVLEENARRASVEDE